MDNRSLLQKRIDAGEFVDAPGALEPAGPRLVNAWKATAWTCVHGERKLDRPCCGGRGVCRVDAVPVGVTGRQCNAVHCPFDSYEETP